MTTNSSAPQRLYLMQVASMGPTNVPVPCYLVQTGDGKNILIDSGLPLTNIPVPEGRLAAQMGKSVIEQLAMLGLQPGDINTLICTHFDGDHVGNNNAFPDAEHIVQRQHYEFASSGNERFARSRTHWDLPASHYRFIDGDTELLPGLELIETSGHTLGHQSVLIRLPNTGLVLLTIDAVTTKGNFIPDRKFGPFDADKEGVRASTIKLLDLVQLRHVTMVIFGHDAAQWQTLKKVPEYYD